MTTETFRVHDSITPADIERAVTLLEELIFLQSIQRFNSPTLGTAIEKMYYFVKELQACYAEQHPAIAIDTPTTP